MNGEHPLAARARGMPEEPGVYRFLDARGKVLYVGKARSLRRRLLSYFGRGALPQRTRSMLERARALDVTLTVSEVEALVLENTLIKRHRPPYNVLLRDDKTYPYIRITTGETWPKAELVRRVTPGDGHLYFGPFMGQYMARRLMEVLRTRFRIRTCHVDMEKGLERPCLYHHMGACLAPCVRGLTTPEAYAEAVHEAVLLLSGRHRELVPRLEAAMWEAAEREDFETAARLRDLIAVIGRLGERQDVDHPGHGDADVFAAFTDGEHATVCVFPYRAGKLVDKREYHFEGVGEVAPGELLAAFLGQYYEANPRVPPRIDLSVEIDPDDLAVLEGWLQQRAGRKVRIGVPKRGPRVRRVDLALRNARTAFELRFRAALAQADHLSRRLARALGLESPVRRIECFDVSHAAGKETVASCVVWERGKLVRREYRTFTIRSVEGIDDFAAIGEAVSRRYRRLRDEGGEFPDLVLIDGGAGQLNAARAALAALGLALSMAALAKREELVYLPERGEPLELDRSDPAHLVLRRVRDEAHRVAVSRHRRKRRKKTLASQLLEIPGIGTERARRLLTTFGSLRGVQAASEDALRRALGPRLGRQVYRALHPNAQSPPV